MSEKQLADIDGTPGGDAHAVSAHAVSPVGVRTDLVRGGGFRGL